MPDSTKKAELHPKHREHLYASGISDSVIDARGYQTIGRTANDNRGRELLKSLKIPGWARNEDSRFPGILIPQYRPTGERVSWQWRPDNPPKDPTTGKVRKYACPVGRASVLDVHPWNRDKIVDLSVPIWITEGVKKGDALTSAGMLAVTLSGVFNWRSTLGTLGDWEDVPLRGRKVFICFDADASWNPNVARAMSRLGKWLVSKGAGPVAYIVVPDLVGSVAVKGVDDYLAAGGTLDGLFSVATSSPPTPTEFDLEQTDAGMAETVAHEVLDGRFKWASGLGWLRWSGNRWQRVDDKVPTEALRSFIVERMTKAVESKDQKEAKRWLKLTGARYMGTILGLAAGVDGVHADATDFDQHPDLLNCPNGVVDLRTGSLLPSDPSLMMTHVTAVPFVHGAVHPDWNAALQAIPPSVHWWYQERCGQGVTGHMPPDDILIVQQGGGDNGKTTITTGIAEALGDYYTLLSDRVLLANPDAHPTELMELRGTRFAMIEETPEARRLNVARLKKTVGTPQITARFIRQDSVTFDVTHTLYLSSNYRPVIEETDHGTWRRLALVRFPYTYRARPEDIKEPTDRLRDPGIRDRIKSGAPGVLEAVLAWLVYGAIRWNARGRVMPPIPDTVLDDTAAWRAESDLLFGYIDERLDFNSDYHVMATELLGDLNDFLKARGHRPWGDKLLAQRFGDHSEAMKNGVEKKRQRKHDGPHGVSIPGTSPTTDFTRLSRRPTYDLWTVRPDPPKQYAAYVGVRFIDDGNELSENVRNVPENATTSENS